MTTLSDTRCQLVSQLIDLKDHERVRGERKREKNLKEE